MPTQYQIDKPEFKGVIFTKVDGQEIFVENKNPELQEDEKLIQEPRQTTLPVFMENFLVSLIKKMENED